MNYGIKKMYDNIIAYNGAEPDRILNEFISGSLLGDGSIEKKSVNCRYCEGSSNYNYILHKYNFLSKYFYTSINTRISKIHKKTGKRYTATFIRTRCHPYLTILHKLWYNNSKIIPKAFVKENLTPFALAIWYMDDGYINKSYRQVHLYTMAFNNDDVKFLTGLLYDKFNITSNVICNNKNQYYIRISRSNVDILMDIIRLYKVNSMEYKFRSV